MHFDPQDPGLRRYGYVRYVPGVLPAARCAALIADAEARGFDDAPITTAAGPVMNQDVRSNARVMYDDVPLADALWAAIRPYTPERIDQGTACGGGGAGDRGALPPPVARLSQHPGTGVSPLTGWRAAIACGAGCGVLPRRFAALVRFLRRSGRLLPGSAPWTL